MVKMLFAVYFNIHKVQLPPRIHVLSCVCQLLCRCNTDCLYFSVFIQAPKKQAEWKWLVTSYLPRKGKYLYLLLDTRVSALINYSYWHVTPRFFFIYKSSFTLGFCFFF